MTTYRTTAVRHPGTDAFALQQTDSLDLVRFGAIQHAKMNDKGQYYKKRLVTYELGLIQKVFLFSAVATGWLIPSGSLRQRIEAFFLFPPVRRSYRLQLRSWGLAASIQGVNFKTADGITLNGWYLPPKADKPTVIYSLPTGTRLRSSEALLHALSKEGYGVLAYEYRGNGASKGKHLEEKGFYADLEAASQFLADKKKTPKNNQILIGESLGSAVTVHVARNQPYKAVVLVSALTSISEVYQAQRTRLGIPDWFFPGMDRYMSHQFDSINKIHEIRSPLLLVHGTQDWLTPLAMGKTLYEKATGASKKEMLIIEKGNHNHLFNIAPEPIIDALDQLIKNT